MDLSLVGVEVGVGVRILVDVGFLVRVFVMVGVDCVGEGTEVEGSHPDTRSAMAIKVIKYLNMAFLSLLEIDFTELYPHCFK